MVTITVNMTTKDFEFIKKNLIYAEQNTEIRSDAEPDMEKVQLANIQIKQILNRFGW